MVKKELSETEIAESIPDLWQPLTQEQRENAFQNICIADNTYFGGCFGKILNDNWQMNY